MFTRNQKIDFLQIINEQSKPLSTEGNGATGSRKGNAQGAHQRETVGNTEVGRKTSTEPKCRKQIVAERKEEELGGTKSQKDIDRKK